MTTPGDPHAEAGSTPAPEATTPPLARPAGSASGGGADAESKPIFELEEDRCPRCGEVMAPSAVVCLKCGYDQRANVVREVETGTVETPAPTDEPSPRPRARTSAEATADAEDFIVPGRLSPKALAIIGGVLTLGAMIGAGIQAYRVPGGGAVLILGQVLYALYTVAVHTGTGIAAVAIAARLGGQTVGRLDLAAGRMFAAFSLFQAVVNARIPLGYTVLTNGLPYLLGGALYFAALMLLFRKDRHTVGVVAIAHFLLWLLLQIGPELAGWVARSHAAAVQ